MKTVVIFGGSGFVGYHIVRRIAKKGYKIIIPYQRSTNEPKLRLFGNVGQIIPLKFINVQDENIVKLIHSADVVINLKTLWQEKTLTFQKGIYMFNADLLNLINKADKNKLYIFFSGLSIDKNSSSKRIKAIVDTEEYIKNNSINSCIIRPGVILGGGDQFLQRLIPIFKMSFFIPLFGDEVKLQPVYIDDIAKAVETIIISKIKGKHIFELVGPEIFTYRNLYTYLNKCLGINRIIIPIPFGLAKLGVIILEKISFNLLTREQLNLFQNDNLPLDIDKNFAYLNIQAQDIRGIIKQSIQKNY